MAKGKAGTAVDKADRHTFAVTMTKEEYATIDAELVLIEQAAKTRLGNAAYGRAALKFGLTQAGNPEFIKLVRTEAGK